MTTLGLLVDVVISGSVLGVKPGDPITRVDALFGPRFVEEGGRGTLRRDYGIVEFYLERTDEAAWILAAVSIQVNRIVHLGGYPIPDVIDERYGPLETAVALQDFFVELGSRAPARELRVRRVMSQDVTYSVDDGSVRVIASLAADSGSSVEVATGQIWAVELSRALSDEENRRVRTKGL